MRLLPLIVDCWIGIVQQDDRRIVRLAGRLTDAQVPELLRTCADAKALELDLTELLSADTAGVDALRRLRSAGAKLVGTHGYIQLRIDSPPVGSRDPS